MLASADGKRLTLRVGPERVLLAAEFEITAGRKLTITDAAGRKIVLRTSDGSPAWN